MRLSKHLNIKGRINSILHTTQAIVTLAPGEPRTIHVYDGRDIFKLRTTAIPSHHCPGAVMFFFEKLDAEVTFFIIRNLAVSQHSKKVLSHASKDIN